MKCNTAKQSDYEFDFNTKQSVSISTHTQFYTKQGKNESFKIYHEYLALLTIILWKV